MTKNLVSKAQPSFMPHPLDSILMLQWTCPPFFIQTSTRRLWLCRLPTPSLPIRLHRHRCTPSCRLARKHSPQTLQGWPPSSSSSHGDAWSWTFLSSPSPRLHFITSTSTKPEGHGPHLQNQSHCATAFTVQFLSSHCQVYSLRSQRHGLHLPT